MSNAPAALSPRLVPPFGGSNTGTLNAVALMFLACIDFCLPVIEEVDTSWVAPGTESFTRTVNRGNQPRPVGGKPEYG